MLLRAEIRIANPKLIRLQIPSRHRSRVVYNACILIDNSESGLRRLAHFYCKCLSGMRTVNPCGHVLTAVSILGTGFIARVPVPRLFTIVNHELHEESENEDI